MFGSSLPPVVCRRAHVLLMMFGSSLPPVVCRRAHVLLMMFGSSLPPVVCRRAHVLLTMFGSSLPPVVCRRSHVLFKLFLFICLYSVVYHILCCVFPLIVCPVLQVSLDSPFSNVYYRGITNQIERLQLCVIYWLFYTLILTETIGRYV